MQELRKGVRKLIIDCILATDMSQHFTITNEFTKHSLEYNLDDASDRTLLSKVGIRRPPAARWACLSWIHDFHMWHSWRKPGALGPPADATCRDRQHHASASAAMMDASWK